MAWAIVVLEDGVVVWRDVSHSDQPFCLLVVPPLLVMSRIDVGGSGRVKVVGDHVK